MLTLNDIYRAVQGVVHERNIRVGVLWVGAGRGIELRHLAAEHGVDPWTTPTTSPYLLGLNVDVDEYLPLDVWRLADEHGTLLYDCREGRTVP